MAIFLAITMDVSIIIVNFNTCLLTLNCIKSIVKYTKKISYEIIVVDNNSSDDSVAELVKMKAKLKKQSIILDIIQNKTNEGFGKANNGGFSKSGGKYVLFLNSDTVITSNVIGEMFDVFEITHDVGVASCALINKDGTMQGTGGYFPTLIRVFSWMTIQDLPFVDYFVKPFHPMKDKSIKPSNSFYKNQKNLDWVTGAFFFTRRDILKMVGMFDEDYFMYTEEVDLCYRIKQKGWRVMYLPKWSIVHLGGASGTREHSVINEFKGVKLFYQKHYPKWKYPILRILLKTGALLRMIAFFFVEGTQSSKIYGKAFKIA